MSRDRILRWGGLISGGILIVFGIVVIVLAINGHSTVSTELKQQKIVGSPDMTPEAIKAESAKAGLKDVKVVGFSPTHTALKFVLPINSR